MLVCVREGGRKVGVCGRAGGRVWGRAWEGRGKGVRADGRKVGVVRGVGVGWAGGHAGMYYYLSNHRPSSQTFNMKVCGLIDLGPFSLYSIRLYK